MRIQASEMTAIRTECRIYASPLGCAGTFRLAPAKVNATGLLSGADHRDKRGSTVEEKWSFG
jgi:hypothetical protein